MSGRKPLRIILAVGLGIRLYQLGTAPFWYDEAYSALVAGRPLGGLLTATAGDVHPPLYYLILWPLGQMGIRAEWAYRLPSLMASLAAIWVLWMILERLAWPASARIAAAAMMALAPAQLHYAQEARMYAILVLLVLLAYYALILERRAWYALAVLGLLYIHNYGMFYCLMLGIVDLVRQRRLSWRMVTSYAVPGLLFLPWLYVIVRIQMAEVAGGYWIQQVTGGSIVYALYMMIGAFSMPDKFQAVSMVVFFGFLAYALARLTTHRPPAWLDFLILGLGPLALAVGLSLAWRPLLLFRALIGSAPFVLSLMVYRLSVHSRGIRLYAAALVAPVIVAGIVGHYLYNVPNKASGDVLGQVAYVRETYGVTTVIHTNDSSWVGWAWYAPEMHNLRITDPACGKTLGSLTVTTRRGLGVVEIAPEDVRAPGLIAWSLGPTASRCDEEQVDRLLAGAEEIRLIESTAYVEAGLWSINK